MRNSVSKRVLPVIFLVSLFWLSKSSAELLRLQPAEAELRGKIAIRNFINPATNKVEKEFVLLLGKPIGVMGDEYDGPLKNVREVQLVIVKNGEVVKKHYLHRNVKVVGCLFHAQNIHHYTDIVLYAIKIDSVIVGENIFKSKSQPLP